nr:LysE family transporter [Desulfobacula sp.]
MTNPKGILFAGAFFPQFLDKASPLIFQGLILCSGCLAVATAIGAGYAVFAGTADGLFQSEKFRKYSSCLSGLVLIFFGIGLLFTGSLEFI